MSLAPITKLLMSEAGRLLGEYPTETDAEIAKRLADKYPSDWSDKFEIIVRSERANRDRGV